MKSRRNFIGVTGLVAGGVAIGGLRLAAETAEGEVLKVVGQYGKAESVCRTEGRVPEVRIRARIGEKDAFVRAFTGPGGAPFERMRAAGNELQFVHRGVAFRLENVV